MRLLQCQLSCHLDDENYSNNSPSFHGSGYSSSSSSSSSSSLMSQQSFQSLPSLSSSSQQFDQKTNSSSSMHHHCISTLKGHTSYVFSLILHGKHLYSGSSNDEIRVWPRQLPSHLINNNPSSENNNIYLSNNIVATFTNYGAVKSLVALGDKLFSAHQDHKIRVWKIDNNNNNNNNNNNHNNNNNNNNNNDNNSSNKNNNDNNSSNKNNNDKNSSNDRSHIQQKRYQCVATLPTMNDRLLRVLLPKNYVKVRRHKSCTWVHHVDTVSSLALSSDGTHLYSASWDRTFKVWRTTDFKCLESVANAHDDAINALLSSKDGCVYTGSADKTIKVWKKHPRERNHSLVATLRRHNSAVNALALSSDASVLYSGACDRSILVWQTDQTCPGNMVVIGALRGHSNAILCLAVVSDLLCSGSADNTVRVWRKSSAENSSYACLAVLRGHTKPVKCLTAIVDPNTTTITASGSSYLIYSGSLDCDIKVWKIWVPFQ